MKLSSSISEIQRINWSFINTFTVQMHFDSVDQSLKKPLLTIWSDYNIDKFNLHLISINTPQFTNSPIESFQGDQWRFHNGRDELYKFSMKFRDSNLMNFYKLWLTSYEVTKKGYFDQVKFNVDIFKDADYISEEKDKIFMRLEEVIIESVGQIDFNNTTENQIAEFEVNFKCKKPKLK